MAYSKDSLYRSCLYKSSEILAKKIRQLGLPIGRLKTGTPPRLEKSSIDWKKVEMQSADPIPVPFSFLNSEIKVKQIECGITRTNINTHKIIYARFFIHALKDVGIKSFFSNCKKMMTANDQLFLEYRTEHDAKLEKVTGEHYRNFLNVGEVEEMLLAYGLKTSYSAQGLGFAKWKADDAFVARHIVSKIDGA